MNSRIEELAYEAEDYADKMVDAGGEFHQHYTQKFAELIIKECVEVAYKYDEPKLSGPGLMIGTMIEEHFGVE